MMKKSLTIRLWACCEILYSYGDILTDPQALANDFIYQMKYDTGREAMLVWSCLRSERMGLPPFTRGPMPGEHTVAILKELGCDDEKIEAMLREHAVKQHP